MLLAFALLVAGLASFGVFSETNASALTPDYNGDPDTIYYFSDYYPTLTYEELENEFGWYNIVIDHQYVDEQEFYDMIHDGYFWGFDYDTCVVIIDIKTFMPDPYELLDLFAMLKSQGCITVYVSIYDEYDYSDTEFLEFLDVFVNDYQFDRLQSFIYNALYDYKWMYRDGDLFDTGFIIDGNLIDVEEYFGDDMDTLCENSPFLRYFLYYLRWFMGIRYDEFENYQELADMLRDWYAIQIYVHVGGNEYVEILSWTTYYFDCVYDVPSSQLCVFGFWKLDDDFYRFLYEAQYEYGYYSDFMPIYILEAEPIDYSEFGLQVITDDVELSEWYGIEWHEAAEYLLECLRELLG